MQVLDLLVYQSSHEISSA